MRPKLNHITLPDNIIGEMKSLIRQTRRNDLEYGFDICEKISKTVRSDDLIIRNECQGTSCDIKLPKGCPKDEKLVGVYHTHPGGTGIMSPSDAFNACKF